MSKSKGVLDKTKTNFNQTYTYWNGTDSIKQISEYYDTVPNTKVELLKNGQLIGTIPYFQKGYHYSKGMINLDTLPTATYTLRVSAPGFETVEASQKIQSSFKILRGGFRADAAIYRDPSDPFNTPQKGDEMTIEFQDNGDDESYYALESVNQTTFGGSRANIYIVRDSANKTFRATGSLRYIDPNMEDNFLSDHTFNGKNYVWRFWSKPNLTFTPNNIKSNPKIGDKVTLKVRSVNKDFVLFLKTLDLANSASDNPFFTEPVILHSNVKKGYGIFTISRMQTVILVLQ